MGVASVKDEDYFRSMIAKVIATRERLRNELLALGFTVLPSSANFVFAAPPAPLTATDVYDRLAEKHIFVRHFKIPGIENYLRITIGTDDQVDTMLTEVKKMI